MPKTDAPFYSFNQGEVSTIALPRVDVVKMRMAASCQLNWTPWVLGAMMLRPGLQFIAETLGDAATRLITFVFARLDVALLELTPNNLRVYVNEQLVTRVAVSTTVNDSTFQGGPAWDLTDTTSGCTATNAAGVLTLTCTAVGGLARAKQDIAVAAGDYNKEHGLRFGISNGPVTVRAGSAMGLADLIPQTVLDTGTHSVTCTPTASDIFLQIDSTDAWNKTLTSVKIDNPKSGAATALVLPTPWGAGDLNNIRFDQSGDIIYCACRGQQQRKIERRSTNAWSVVLYRPTDGPFNATASLAANFTPGAYYGNTTLTSDRSYFQAGHVGCMFRLFSSGQFYQTVLGNSNAFSPAVRVVGVGTVARNYTWTVSGTWVGKVTLQRSFDGPDSGFTDVSNVTSNGTIASSTGTGGTPNLDNLICWERVGFKGGDYTSGSATVISNYAGGGGFAVVRVTGYTSATSVNIEILQAFATLTATSDWVEGQWSSASNGNFPTSLCFVEGRLGQFGQNNVWISESNNYTGYSDQDSLGDPLGASGAIIEQLGSGDVDNIPWAVSALRLLIGRERSIASARSSSFDEPLTPTAFSVKDCATQGAAHLQALKVDQRALFLQQSGRRVYELTYDAYKMDYVPHDKTRLNLDIGKPGFVDNAIMRQPDTIHSWVRGDGQVAMMLDDPDDDITCWWRMQSLGVIENTAVLPGSGIEDLQYFVVNRTINGVTRRFIERLALRDDCVGGSLNKQADSFLTYTGAPSATITLPHLPNTSVVLWGDGKSLGTVTTDGNGVATLPNGATASNIVAGLGGAIVTYPPDPTVPQAAANTLSVGTQYNGYPAEVWADQNASGRLKHVGTLTVSGGILTLPNNRQSTSIVAFLGYVAPFESAKLAYAAAPGRSALTKKKQIDDVGLLLFNAHAQGLQFGQSFDHLEPLPQIESGGAVDQNLVWGEYDDVAHSLPGTWDTDARLCLLAQAPLPCMVGGVVLEIQTNG